MLLIEHGEFGICMNVISHQWQRDVGELSSYGAEVIHESFWHRGRAGL